MIVLQCGTTEGCTLLTIPRLILYLQLWNVYSDQSDAYHWGQWWLIKALPIYQKQYTTMRIFFVSLRFSWFESFDPNFKSISFWSSEFPISKLSKVEFRKKMKTWTFSLIISIYRQKENGLQLWIILFFFAFFIGSVSLFFNKNSSSALLPLHVDLIVVCILCWTIESIAKPIKYFLNSKSMSNIHQKPLSHATAQGEKERKKCTTNEAEWKFK